MGKGRDYSADIAHDGIFPQQLVDGYFDGKPYNEKALQASILVNSYIKIHYWNQTKKFKQIKNVQEYLVKTKSLLDK